MKPEIKSSIYIYIVKRTDHEKRFSLNQKSGQILASRVQ